MFYNKLRHLRAAPRRSGRNPRWRFHPIGRFSASLSTGKRMNVFFLHFTTCGRDEDPLALNDINNTTLELKYSLR